MTERQRQVFVVEDDVKIGAVLCDYIAAAGHRWAAFTSGAAALAAAEKEPPDLVILDVMLPGLNGIDVCKRLRVFSAAPTLMLTARTDDADRILGLEAGADDYVCKPFSVREVMARVAALLRRAEGRIGPQPGRAAKFACDEPGRRILWSGVVLSLSPSEYELLIALMKQPGRIFTRDQLLDRLGAGLRDVSDRAVDSHIKNIRRKIVAIDPDAACIVSIYGVGYRFDP